MKIRYLFNKTKHSDDLIQYTEEKLLKILDKYTEKSIEAVISFHQEGVSYKADCHYFGGKSLNIKVEGKSLDLFESVDFMLHKLESQLRRKKEKLKDHHLRDQKISQILDPSPKEDDWDDEAIDAEDVIKYEIARKKRAG